MFANIFSQKNVPKYLYHKTDAENLKSIVEEGVLRSHYTEPVSMSEDENPILYFRKYENPVVVVVDPSKIPERENLRKLDYEGKEDIAVGDQRAWAHEREWNARMVPMEAIVGVTLNERIEKKSNEHGYPVMGLPTRSIPKDKLKDIDVVDEFERDVSGMRWREHEGKVYSKKIELPEKYAKGFRSETELGMDHWLARPTNKEREYDFALTEMTPDDFLDIQLKQIRKDREDFISRDDFLRGAGNTELYEQILRGEEHEATNYYDSDSKLPLPVVEYDEEGDLSGFQEGRSRAVAAKNIGMERMPVLIAKKHKPEFSLRRDLYWAEVNKAQEEVENSEEPVILRWRT